MSEDAPDPAVLCAERQLQLLGEMADIGMEMLRDLKSQADPAEAFVRLSRAVRLTFALETKTHQELRDLKAENLQVREADEERTAEQARVAKETAVVRNKAQTRRLVLSVAESESESLEDYTATWDKLEERLDRDGRFRNIGEWQTRYAVERLCEDLNLHPDWECWTGNGWNGRFRSVRPRFERRPSLIGATDSATADHRPQLE